MEIKHLTKGDFDETIQTGVVLVDFWAEWCMPCRMLAPLIEELAQEYDGKVAVCKVDIDQHSELALRYGVLGIPTVIVFKDGAPARSFVGVRPKEEYVDYLSGE